MVLSLTTPPACPVGGSSRERSVMDELERGPVYTIGDVVYYRASSLGGCVRMLALARQGFDPLPATGQIAEVFKAGRDAEQQVWAKGIVQGRAQEYVELPISSTIRVAGHLDCWEPERVYEIKSQSEGEWGDIEKSSLWYRYKFQISVYMHATGLPLTVVRVRRNKDGSISDEERQDYEAGRRRSHWPKYGRKSSGSNSSQDET